MPMPLPAPNLSPRSQAILDAAVTLIHDKGFYRTTIDDVGAAVGLTGPALYRHFRSKSGILVAIFDATFEYLLNDAERQELIDMPAHDALTTIINEHIDFVLTHRALLRIIRSEARELPAEAHARFRANQQRYLQAWVNILRRVRSDLDNTRAILVVAGAVELANRYGRRQNEVEGDELRTWLAAMVNAVLMVPPPKRIETPLRPLPAGRR
jgi:AcrR family transcriptional regulator